MSIKALTFGEVLWDVIEGHEHLGGAPLNVAAHMAKLKCNSAVVTRIGTDVRGIKAKAAIESVGVDTSYLQLDGKYPTGTAEVTLAEGGIPAFVLKENVAFDFIDVKEDTVEAINGMGYDVLCFGTIVQRNPVSQNSLTLLLEKGNFKHVFYDVNIRLNFMPAEVIQKSMSHATIVKLNDSEVDCLSECLYGEKLEEQAFVEKMTENSPDKIICITKGEQGCTVHYRGDCKTCPGHVVEVADTVGAGDAFSAGFLTSYLKDGDPFKAATVGNRLGAFVASANGAIPAYSEEIKAIMD